VAEIRDSITHLIVVSCTGFFAPGLDLMIARQLELRPDVERTLVGFMGCAAAFNGLRVAEHIVQANPSARALVVCCEICSIHLQPGQRRVDMVVGSLFADGAAACIVGMPQPDQHDIFEIRQFYTNVKPDTETDMVWQIGNQGFVLHISPQVPDELGQVAPQAIRQLFSCQEQISFWGVHPGGRGIIDRLGEIFQLTPTQLEASRTVLREYGNMSSPTVLFVLHELREQLRQQTTTHTTTEHPFIDGVVMAFGPGLVSEMARLAYLPRPS
jgi:predicted naringenin-chalcone synthase